MNNAEELMKAIEEMGPMPQRMIIVKQLANGDIHAEDNDGQMLIINMEEGTVKSFLMDDTEWVYGTLPSPGAAWEVIGFHLGMTDGHQMERTRYATQ